MRRFLFGPPNEVEEHDLPVSPEKEKDEKAGPSSRHKRLRLDDQFIAGMLLVCIAILLVHCISDIMTVDVISYQNNLLERVPCEVIARDPPDVRVCNTPFSFGMNLRATAMYNVTLETGQSAVIEHWKTAGDVITCYLNKGMPGAVVGGKRDVVDPVVSIVEHALLLVLVIIALGLFMKTRQ